MLEIPEFSSAQHCPTPPQFSTVKYEERALFFNSKIVSIRASIAHDGNKADYRKPCNVTMGSFNCITLVYECNSSTSDIDPVPTAFFTLVFNSVLSYDLDIINTSGIFPDAFKTAVVKPLLKNYKI